MCKCSLNEYWNELSNFYSYLITPPYFEEVSITSKQTGKKATIRNINFDPTYQAIWIQEARLEGKPYTKNWIGHSFFLDGGTLELVLGRNESEWGTHEADLPPSLSTTGLYLENGSLSSDVSE